MSRKLACGRNGPGLFEQYLSNIDPLFTEDIKVLRSNPTNFVDSSVQHDDEKRGAVLFFACFFDETKAVDGCQISA